jgi:2-polyprenyl-6-methoxyphenol hydroxylase-like FAD-dependent oxidoreductase
MSGRGKVLVAGGGIGGLCSAIGLLRQGIAVDLVEIKEENTALGVGIIQPANALRALDDLGLMEKCLAAGFQVDEWRYFDADGTQLHNFRSLRLAGDDIPAYNAVPRPVLARILLDTAYELGARIWFGTEITRHEEVADGIEITLGNGHKDTFDFAIGAEGIRSPLRRRLFGNDYEPQYLGHSVWRVNAKRPPELTYQPMYWGIGSKAGLVPLSQSTMYLLLVTDEPDNPYYPKEDMYGLLRERLKQYGGYIGEVRDNLSPSDEIIYTPVEEVRLPSPWYKGRILLIGDAAHAGGPHLSQGAAMAIEDAVVISELAATGQPVSTIFERFMQRRYERCLYIQNTTRDIGNVGRASDPKVCAARNANFKNMKHDVPRPHEEVIAQRP